MADGLYWVVCGVDNGEEGGQDPEQDGGGHQGDGGDVQLVQQERSLPKHCPSEDLLPQLNKLDPNWTKHCPNWTSLALTEINSAPT